MEIRDGLGDTREGQGLVVGSPEGLGRVEGPFPRSGMGRMTHPKVLDELGDPQGGQGQIGGPSGSSEMSLVTLPEVWDGLEDPRGDLGRVGGILMWSGMG